jgi:hypothetical protein
MILFALSLLFVSLGVFPGIPLVQASQITKYSLGGLVPSGISQSGIPSGLLARDGYVYFPYGGGIARMDPTTNSLKLYSLPGPGPNSLDLSETYAWALTGGDTPETNYLFAVNLADGRTTKWHLEGNEYPAMNGLLVENDSSIWLTGTSLNHFNPNTGQMKRYPLPCIASRCWTNSSNIFRPLWANEKIWALVGYCVPAPNLNCGEALIEIDPHNGSMSLYPIPKFYHNGRWLVEEASDMTSDGRGNLWLMLGDVLARFNITTGNFEFVESIFGGSGPAACDREGDLFFPLLNYTQSLIEYSPSSQLFTEYWTEPTPSGGIQDVVVDSNDVVWFVNTYFTGPGAEFADLYSLSVGGSGTTITTTALANSTQTQASTYPTSSLTYTSSLASTVATPVSTAIVTQTTSTLGMVSTMTVTQTLALAELHVPVAAVILALILVTMSTKLARRVRPLD